MPSYLSAKNRTTTPLLASATFSGEVDNSLNYTNCDVSLVATTKVEIRIYGSITGQTWALIFDEQVDPGVQYFQTLLLYHPFLRSEVQNLQPVNQTSINYQLIYREHSHAFTLTDITLTAPVEVVDKQRVSEIVWNSIPVSAGSNSLSVGLNASKFTTLSVYGSTNIPSTLTIQFSKDDINWFDSQYSFAITSVTGANFGASISCAVSYVRLKRTDVLPGLATISAIIEST
jgi:hypothetical protein